MLWGKELLVDATKVQGNASRDSMVPRLKEVVDDHLVELFSDEDEEDAAEGRPERAPPMLHPPSAPGARERVGHGRSEALGPAGDLPPRPRSPALAGIRARLESEDEPDRSRCHLNHHGGQATVLGYQTHYMIDGGKARIILHALTMPGDVMENEPFLDQFRRVLFRWKLHPYWVIADTKYSTIENIRELDAMGITAYMPLRDWEHKTDYFGASHFTYDPEQDVYRCPEDAVLRPHGSNGRRRRRSTGQRQRYAMPGSSRKSARPAIRAAAPSLLPC